MNQGTGILREQAQDKVILPFKSQQSMLTKTLYYKLQKQRFLVVVRLGNHLTFNCWWF